MSQIIFLGGIHGAGKGTISQTICANTTLIPLSASDLIKWKEITPDQTNKIVENIADTQERLIDGLNAKIESEKNYLLDGHFCLLNNENAPSKIPLDTFIKIRPVIIGVVVVEIEIILHRLSLRDNKSYNHNTLKEMQQMEEDYAKEVSSKLNIPFTVIRNDEPAEIIHLIQHIVR